MTNLTLDDNHPFGRLPVWMLFVFDVQVFECCYEGLCLVAPCCACHYWSVADRALCSNSDNAASQRSAHMACIVNSLGHATHMETTAEVNTVQDLQI